MDNSLKSRINNQIFRFEATIDTAKVDDSVFTLDFSRGTYRQDDLAGLIRDIVPFFTLTEKEIAELNKSEWTRRSFTRISDANESQKGDYGELLLFVILSMFYDAPKFVTKARLRSNTTEQIKGFDCAHFTIDESGVPALWLGEAKFHKSFTGALSSAFSSLSTHLNEDHRIKSELRLLGGEIEINKGIVDDDTLLLLKSYVDGGRSLDKISIRVPVLLTYDSAYIDQCCGNIGSDIQSREFQDGLTREIKEHFQKIHKKSWPQFSNINIIFIVMPFESVGDIKSKLAVMEMGAKF